MKGIAKAFLKKFTFWGVLGFAAITLAGLYAGGEALKAMASAYLLSMLFVGSVIIVLQKLDAGDNKRFYRVFLITISARFVLVLVAILFVLLVTKIHQIYFTVSFIISYIFHSVNEIIFINKTLENELQNK